MVVALSPAAAYVAQGSPDRMLPLEAAGSSLNHARLFLGMLKAPDLLIELRRLRHGRMTSTFCPRPESAAEAALQFSDDYDVYAGVLPRTKLSGGKDSLAPARLIFVECDDPTATQRALNNPIPPNIVVRSSPGKAHCYWMTRELLKPEYVELACKRLAFHLGGDMRATDAARILRVPGTWNHKYEKPEWVYLSRFGGDPCSAKDLVGHLPDPRAPAQPRPSRPRVSDPTTDRLRMIPAAEYAPWLAGRELNGHLMQCPFHNGGQERTPSFHVRGPNETLWHCFGCGEGSDIFGLAARLWGLDEQRDFRAIVERLGRELR